MADAATILRVNLLGAALVADTFFDLAFPGSVAVFIASLAGHPSGGVSPEVIAELESPGAGSPGPDRAGVGRWSHRWIGVLAVEARGDPDVPPSRACLGASRGPDPVGVARSDQ